MYGILSFFTKKGTPIENNSTIIAKTYLVLDEIKKAHISKLNNNIISIVYAIFLLIFMCLSPIFFFNLYYCTGEATTDAVIFAVSSSATGVLITSTSSTKLVLPPLAANSVPAVGEDVVTLK